MKGGCPSSFGAKGINPAAYSPKTKLLYVPLYHTCMTYEPVESRYKQGQPWVGATITDFAYDKAINGGLLAYDAITKKSHWFNQEPSVSTSGLLATAENLLFYNAGNRWFKAVDAANGKLLWQYNAGAPISSNPFSYHHKGKQYIGIMAGLGGIKSIFGQSFWGEPVMVACSLGSSLHTIEDSFTYFDSNWCYSFVVPAARGGLLHVFSL